LSRSTPPPELFSAYRDSQFDTSVLAVKYGVSRRTVYEWFKFAGIKSQGKDLHNKVDRDVLERMYRVDHISTREIAKKYNVSQATIYNWLKILDIKTFGKRRPLAGSRLFKCAVCGIDVLDKPYRRHLTCSAACRSRLRGAAHWNYKGEETVKKQKGRTWLEYREWYALVLAASDYRCIKCKKRGGRLVVHHVFNWSRHRSLRFMLENGACMCHPCHQSFHNQYGRHYTNGQMFSKWLSQKDDSATRFHCEDATQT
jgi:hypothetical protein